MRYRTLLDPQVFNPNRPPDWRWQRACEIVDGGLYASTKREDELTCRAVYYIRASYRYVSERGMRSLAKRYPEIFLAMRLSTEGGPRELELRARVLARQSDRAITREVGLTAAAVATYCGLFFAVRDRLGARNYITFQVAGQVPHLPPSPATLMLLSAYHHGPHAVDAWLDYLQHANEPHDLTTAIGRQREAIDLLLAIHQLPNDEKTLKGFLKSARFIFGKSFKPFEMSNGGSINATYSELVVRRIAEISFDDSSDAVSSSFFASLSTRDLTQSARFSA